MAAQLRPFRALQATFLLVSVGVAVLAASCDLTGDPPANPVTGTVGADGRWDPDSDPPGV